MFKEDYILAMDKLEFRKDLKQETMRKIRNKTFSKNLNWKYKVLIVVTTLEVYFFSFRTLTCR